MKAQIGQIFIYVATLVVVSFILFYGYTAISTFKDKADQVALIQLRNDVQDTIETLSLDFGSVRIKELVMPENIRTICFIRNYKGYPENLQGTSFPIMEDSVNSGIDNNIFLLDETVEDSFKAGNIYVENSYLCFDAVSGKVKVRVEGKGDHVVINQ